MILMLLFRKDWSILIIFSSVISRILSIKNNVRPRAHKIYLKVKNLTRKSITLSYSIYFLNYKIKTTTKRKESFLIHKSFWKCVIFKHCKEKSLKWLLNISCLVSKITILEPRLPGDLKQNVGNDVPLLLYTGKRTNRYKKIFLKPEMCSNTGL